MNVKVPPLLQSVMHLIVIVGLIVVDLVSVVAYYQGHSVDAYLNGLQAYTQSRYTDSFRNLHLVNNYFWFSYVSELEDLQWKEFESSFRISIEERIKAADCQGTANAVDAYFNYFPNASSSTVSFLQQTVIDCYDQQAKRFTSEGMLNNAIASYQAILSNYPGTVAADEAQEGIADLYLQMAENAWANGDRDGALMYLQTIFDHFAGLPQANKATTRALELHGLIGDDARTNQNYAEAISHYQHILEVDPAGVTGLTRDLPAKISVCYLEWARQARDQKDFTLSEQIYSTLIQDWGDTPSAVEASNELIQVAMAHAVSALDNQDGKTALQIYRTVSTDYPASEYAQKAAEMIPIAQMAYADQLLVSKDFVAAIENYTQLTLAYPGTSYGDTASQQIDLAYLAYAADLQGKGDFTGAYRMYDELSQFSNNTDIRSQATAGFQSALLALAQDESGQGKELFDLAVQQACSRKPTTSPALSLSGDFSTQGASCSLDYILPEDLVALTPGSLHYVVLFEEGTDLLETCTFSGVFKIYRERYWWNLTIVEVSTGKVVTTETFYGSTPKVCPRKAFYTVGQNEKTYFGDKPDQSQTDEWLRRWFER